jgi:DUF1009 family protein
MASGRRRREMDVVEQHILRRLQTSTVTAVVVNGEVHSPALEDVLSPLELEIHRRWLEAKHQQDKERLLREIADTRE